MKQIVVRVVFNSKYPEKNYSVMLDEDTYAHLQFELYRAKICEVGKALKAPVRLAEYPTVKSFMHSINRVIFQSVVLFELEYEREKKLFEYTERLYSDERIPDTDIEKYRLAFLNSQTEIYTEKLFMKDFARRFVGVTEIISI